MRFLFEFTIQLLAGLFWSALMLGFSDIKTTFLTIIAAFLHEFGHVFALKLLKKSFSFPKLVTSGFRIKTNGTLSYKEEILICGAGPLINLLLFAFSFPFSSDFAIINLATAVSNLLPIPDYDGYKIIDDLISIKFGYSAAEGILPHVTIAICAAAVFISLFLIYLLNGGYWIFFVFFTVMVQQILIFQNKTKNENS